MNYEMTKDEIICVYNTGSRNFIQLKYNDMKYISQFLPEPGSEEFHRLPETARITVLRVFEIMKIQKEGN